MALLTPRGPDVVMQQPKPKEQLHDPATKLWVKIKFIVSNYSTITPECSAHKFTQTGFYCLISKKEMKQHKLHTMNIFNAAHNHRGANF